MSGPFSGDDAVAVVRPGGLIYLGQDQDNRGGGFHPRQSWSGEITQFNIWDFALGTSHSHSVSVSVSLDIINYVAPPINN